MARRPAYTTTDYWTDKNEENTDDSDESSDDAGLTAGSIDIPDPTEPGSMLSDVPTTETEDPHDGQQGSDSEGDGTPDPYSGERVTNDTGVSFADKTAPSLTVEQAEQALSGSVSVPDDAMEGDTITISGRVRNTGNAELSAPVKLTWKKNNRGVDLKKKTVSLGPGQSAEIETEIENVPALEFGRKIWLMAEAGTPTSTVEIAQTVLEVEQGLSDSHPLADTSRDPSSSDSSGDSSDDSTESDSKDPGGAPSSMNSSDSTSSTGDSTDKQTDDSDNSTSTPSSAQLKQYAPYALGAAVALYGVSKR